MKIAYLLDCFPQISETFILNEIVALKKIDNSIDIFIYSLRKPKESLAHNSAGQFKPLYINEIIFPFHTILFYALKKLFTRPIGVIKSCYYFIRVKKGIFFKYYLYNLWIFLFRLFKISYSIEKNGCEHIHSHFALITTQYALCAYLVTKIPYSFTSHAYDIFVKHQILKQKHKYASFAVTVTEFNKKYLIDNFNINPDKINIIYCGTDTTLFKQKKYHDRKPSVFTIVSIGRLVEKKGFPYLIHACKLFKDKYGNNFQCLIIGTGSSYDSLKNLINKYNMNDEIKLSGAKTQNEIIDILNHCDIFVLPCVQAENGDMDSAPVVIKEAMSMGIVTVSTNISGIPELMGDAGFLVPPKDNFELFKAIEKIYLMSLDEKNKIATKSRELIKTKFNINMEVKKLLILFKNTRENNLS